MLKFEMDWLIIDLWKWTKHSIRKLVMLIAYLLVNLN